MNFFSTVWIWPLFFTLISGTPLLANLRRRNDPSANTIITMLLPRSADEPAATSAPLVATYPADSQPITQAPISAIFGGVMGGLLFVIACAIVFFYIKKRQRQKLVQSTPLAPTPLPMPKFQPSVRVEQVDDASPGLEPPIGYNDGSGNRANGGSNQTNILPLAHNGLMGLPITTRTGVRDARGAQAR